MKSMRVVVLASMFFLVEKSLLSFSYTCAKQKQEAKPKKQEKSMRLYNFNAGKSKCFSGSTEKNY